MPIGNVPHRDLRVPPIDELITSRKRLEAVVGDDAGDCDSPVRMQRVPGGRDERFTARAPEDSD